MSLFRNNTDFSTSMLCNPAIEQIVHEYIEKQDALEKQNCSSLDMAADPTAYALGKILTECSDDKVQKRILDRIGYCIGR